MGRCSAPLFGALDALAVDDRRRRAGFTPGPLPAQYVERVVDAIERAVLVPTTQVAFTVLRGGKSFGSAAH